MFCFCIVSLTLMFKDNRWGMRTRILDRRIGALNGSCWQDTSRQHRSHHRPIPPCAGCHCWAQVDVAEEYVQSTLSQWDRWDRWRQPLSAKRDISAAD